MSRSCVPVEAVEAAVLILEAAEASAMISTATRLESRPHRPTAKDLHLCVRIAVDLVALGIANRVRRGVVL